MSDIFEKADFVTIDESVSQHGLAVVVVAVVVVAAAIVVVTAIVAIICVTVYVVFKMMLMIQPLI